MTVTTKVEGRTYADLSTWGKKFDKKAMKAYAGYGASVNLGSQQLVQTDANPDTTALVPCMINGVMIQNLAAGTSAWVTGESSAKGTVLANGQSVYVLYKADATGNLEVDLAGVVALDAAVALKIDVFDPSTYVAIGLGLVDAGGAVTLGTTDINTITTVDQLIGGPILPHPDNLYES